MDFQHNPFVSHSQDFISFTETTSPPSTGSSSSYSTFQYPSFTSDSSVPNTPTALCLPSIQSFGTSDEWTEYSQNQHFQNIPLWTNDCDSDLNLFHTQLETSNSSEKKK